MYVEGGIEKKRSNKIIDGADHTFEFSILLGCFWARKTDMYTVFVKDVTDGISVKFSPMIKLEGMNITF